MLLQWACVYLQQSDSFLGAVSHRLLSSCGRGILSSSGREAHLSLWLGAPLKLCWGDSSLAAMCRVIPV